MLINKHDCYNLLFEWKANGMSVEDDISQLITTSTIPSSIIKYLKEVRYPTVDFYLTLNNKAHKVIKNLLECENAPISEYIKIATSLITQAMITLEHSCQDDVNAQNHLIENLGLATLSNGLATYFSTGDATLLVNAVLSNRNDVKTILDS